MRALKTWVLSLLAEPAIETGKPDSSAPVETLTACASQLTVPEVPLAYVFAKKYAMLVL